MLTLRRGSGVIGEGVIWKQIVAYAIPLLLSNFLQQLYNTADLLILGNFAGKEAMAAVGATGSLIGLIVGMFIGLSIGASVVLSQHYGSDDPERIHATVHTAVYLSLLTGGVLTVLGLTAAPRLLDLMGTPPDVMDEAVTYMRWYFIGTVPMMVYNFGASLLRAVGDSKRPLYFLMAGTGSNIILTLICVAGFRWGVAGAAVATVVSQIITSVLVLLSLMKSETAYRLFWKDLKIDREILGHILQIGIPAGIQSSLVSLSNVVIQSAVNSFGSSATAGVAASGKIDGFMYMPMNAFGLTATTFVGQNIGAKQPRRAMRGACITLGLGVATAASLGFIIRLNSEFFVGLFTREAEVMEYSYIMLSYFTPFYWMFGIGEILSGVIRGAGKSATTMVIFLFSMTGFRLAWILLVLPRIHEFEIIAMAYPLSWLITAILVTAYFLSRAWFPEGFNIPRRAGT